MTREMTGAEMVIQALADQNVEHVFGYPGGAVLPIYDAIFSQNQVRHILVRHEQGAVHAAEGYARSTGKVGCVLVTSGPGATNAVTGLTDALCEFDSDRLHHRPGADASDRQRRFPGMRHGRHHAAVHKVQLPGQAYRGSAARSARGLSHCLERPAGAGCRRRAERHSVRKGHLFQAEGFPAHRLQAQAQGRHGQDQAGHRPDGARQASAVLHRRRRHQFRQGGLRSTARVRQAHRLSDHVHVDGSRRIPGG